jgi:protein O-mannosyl-transferase
MFVWAVADGSAASSRRRMVPIGVAAAVLTGCLVVTSLQLRYWKNSITLLERAAQVAGGNFLVHVMLGNARAERGELDAALLEYQTAVRLRPADPGGWQRAGTVLTQQGRAGEAVPFLEKAIQLAPAWPEPRRRLAFALLTLGRRDEARAAYLSLIPLVPKTADAQRDLGDMLAEGQQMGEAIAHYREALRLKPDFVLVLNNLAWLRATAAQPEFRDGLEAVPLAERACALSQRRNPSFLGTLAAAYAETGRFADAVKTMQEAMALAKAAGADQLLPVQAQMLAQFQAGKPFHQGG